MDTNRRMQNLALGIALLGACCAVLFPGIILADEGPAARKAEAATEEATQPADVGKAEEGAKPAESGKPTDAGKKEAALAVQQEQVAERFRELEKLLLRMAELTAPTDARRAALLRQAVAQSKQRDLDHQFDLLIDLLRQERLAVVVKSQGELHQDLIKLLELLLSEDRSKRIEAEKERVKQYLQRVNKIIKEQKSVQGETRRDGDAEKLAERQGELSDKTDELAQDLKQEAAKAAPPTESPHGPGDQPSPPDGGKQGEKPADGKPADDKPAGENPSDDKQAGDEKNKSDQNEGDKGKPDDKKAGDSKPADSEKKKEDSADKPEGEKSEPAEGGKGEPGDKSEPGKGGDAGKPQEGQPSDSSAPQVPPPDSQEKAGGTPSESNESPAQQRLEKAKQRMKEAQQKLEEAQRKEATEKQAEALKELEQAKAELEEILRQLREEEIGRTLAMLEARFRKMLDQQVEVYEGTKRLDAVPEPDRDRDDEIEAGRLSRKQTLIVAEADKALLLLEEEGSAVAFPAAVVEMREDMQQVATRLAEAKVNAMTQGIETDIIAALEEMIASLQKAQKDAEKGQKPGESGGGGGDDEGPPLVDTLAELKMIRALQMRVNQRTARFAEMLQQEQAEQPEIVDSLKRLAEREQRIHKVTRDIVVGRNR